MKILLISGDVTRWAISLRAEAIKRNLPNLDITILGGDAEHPQYDPDEYDLIHVLYSGGATYHSEKLRGHKYIASVASQRTLDFKYESKEALIEFYKNAKAVVALNPRLKEAVDRLAGIESVYIPNGVDTELFKQDFTVGFVGCNQPQHFEYKGYHLIKKACEDLGVKLITDGNEYPHKVTPHEEMPEFYKKIDCLCIASEGEGSNNPTLEALAMNVPVVSTDVGNARELGCILVERSVEGIMDGIKEVYKRKLILEKYTWPEIARQYEKLYQN